MEQVGLGLTEYEVNNIDELEKIEVHSVRYINFCLLVISSFGLYSIYWMYQRWKFFQMHDRIDIFPVLRSLFSVLFFYSLIERIRKYSIIEDVQAKYSSGALSFSYVILNLLTRAPEPIFYLCFLQVLCFHAPLNDFNRAIIQSEEYTLKIPNSFTTAQVFILIIGFGLWVLVILGSLALMFEDQL